MEKLKTYLFSYEHDGITWTVEVPATSPEDARARLQKYPDAKYEGLPVFKLPALFERFVSLYFWLRDVPLSALAEKIRNIPGVPLPLPKRPSPSTPESIEEAVIRSLRR